MPVEAEEMQEPDIGEIQKSDANSEPMRLAKELLSKASDQLDIAKKQYESAKTTYDSTKSLCGLLEGSDNQVVLSSPKTNLCDDCARIPLKIVFKEWPMAKAQRRRIGDLFQAVERQSWCAFCKFLIEAFQIGDEHQSERLGVHLKPRDSAIYFAPDPDGLPWFRRAGLNVELQPCPFVWLQTGMPTQTGVPHICVTLKPESDKSPLVPNDIRPRQRDPLEAFNGAMDYTLVQSWLEKCKTQHGTRCNKPPKSDDLALDIDLIDVSTRQLVRRSSGDKYVALSYVWGKGTELRLKTSDISHAPSAGDFGPYVPLQSTRRGRLPARAPQTMEDAISFVQWLGEKYLWIDLFCINQNNDAEMQTQISSMNTIFSSSFVTLISLDGDDADWGLPGVSRPLLQTTQPSINTNDGQLIATFMYSVWDHNGTSVWDSRAWTLQERLLSPRCIVFSKNNISMTCQEEYFHDCLDMNHNVKTTLGDDYFREDGSDIKLDGQKWDMKVYDALVSVYSGRKLTVEADALKACLGSLNIISQSTGYTFAAGLPKEDIWRALIWKPHHDHVLQRRSDFPSWSWLGWSGRSEYPYWTGDMADYINPSSDTEDLAKNPPAKRRRIHWSTEEAWHQEAAEIIRFPIEGERPSYLTMSTTLATFKYRLLRRHGMPHKNLRQDSQQSKIAVGDHWTILGTDGQPLRNTTGEHAIFEPTDVFFRLNAEHSGLLERQDCAAELAFVHQWPKIRDSLESDKWRFDMVSALLIVRNEDETAVRLASVLLERDHWMAQNPVVATVTLT